MGQSDDDDLWGKYKKGIKPLKTKVSSIKPTTSFRMKGNVPNLPTPAEAVQSYILQDDRPLQVQNLTRKERRRLDPEATLDLHGMTQEQAYAQLKAFLASSYLKGHRCVLVITGKARENEGGGEQHTLHHGRGILRRQLPTCLAQSEFRTYVASYDSANLRHGGTGAYYVFLKSRL